MAGQRRRTLRSPWRWLLAPVFGTFVLVGLMMAINAETDPVSVVGGAVVAAIGLWMFLGWVWWNGVFIRDDLLRVRMWSKSYRFERSDVTGVELENTRQAVASYPAAQPVLVRADGERVSLVILQQPGGKRGHGRVVGYVEAIEEWQASASEHDVVNEE